LRLSKLVYDLRGSVKASEDALHDKSRISWTAFTTYEHCPQRFLWRYGWGDIDLGHGPGKGIPKPEKRSEHHAVMGSVIQSVLESLYNNELYRDPVSLHQTLLALVENHWAKKEKKSFIDWDRAGMSREDMLQVCRDGVLGYLKTMKAHRLLGNYARSEVHLVGWVDKYLCLHGYADFIIRRDDTGVTLLDGKNSLRKNCDPDQLRWYALLFRLSYKEMPTRIGFVYFRYPYGSEAPSDSEDTITEEGVDWVPFTEEDLRGLALRAQEARNGMRKGKFSPKPSPDNCKYCDFLSICEARASQKEINAAKRKSTKRLDEIGEGGFSDFSM